MIMFEQYLNTNAGAWLGRVFNKFSHNQTGNINFLLFIEYSSGPVIWLIVSTCPALFETTCLLSSRTILFSVYFCNSQQPKQVNSLHVRGHVHEKRQANMSINAFRRKTKYGKAVKCVCFKLNAWELAALMVQTCGHHARMPLGVWLGPMRTSTGSSLWQTSSTGKANKELCHSRTLCPLLVQVHSQSLSPGNLELSSFFLQWKRTLSFLVVRRIDGLQ